MVLTFGSKNSFILPLTLKSCDLDFGIRHMKLRRRLGQLFTLLFIMSCILPLVVCNSITSSLGRAPASSKRQTCLRSHLLIGVLSIALPLYTLDAFLFVFVFPFIPIQARIVLGSRAASRHPSGAPHVEVNWTSISTTERAFPVQPGQEESILN